MNKQKRREIFLRFKQKNPHPTTELNYTSSFELLIAVMLSAQATDIGVNKATLKLFAEANTPEAIIALGEEQLKTFINSINFYHGKARHIIKTCYLLMEKHQGKVPENREALEALPGVGRKTANVILNTAFGQLTMAVDTHIFRVANRTRIAKGSTPLTVELALLRHVEKEFLKDAHHWLLLHGRYTCVARKPRCSQCLIQDLCEYPDKVVT